MVSSPGFGGSARRFAVALSVMATLALGTGAQAGAAPSQVGNGECTLTTNAPLIATAPRRIVSKQQLNCVHEGGLQVQLQLWKAAGAAGRVGDIKLDDSGWKVWVLSRGRGAARSEDRACAATPRNGTYYVRARLRSAKAGQPGLVTSAWVSSVSARLSC